MKSRRTLFPFTLVVLGVVVSYSSGHASDFASDVSPVLAKFCIECHSGDDPNGEVDFAFITTAGDISRAFEIWESVADHLVDGTMPPEDHPQPSAAETERVLNWYREFTNNIQARPAVHRPRRLSVTEYRNTLRSVMGFDLEVDVVEAEQTIVEKSLVIKLLPTDPPGQSGFKNDTHGNPLTTVVWDQYSYLTRSAIDELFSRRRTSVLAQLAGARPYGKWTIENSRRLIATLLRRTRRRPVDASDLDSVVARLGDKTDQALIDATKIELRTLLMSPTFIYRGLLADGERGKRQMVDPFEFAERLSYFFWADMPDRELDSAALDGSILDSRVYLQQIDRMLASPKASALAEVFASEWLTLSEIELASNNPPQMHALKSQPIDFMNYLFTSDRPLLEMIDSTTTFINPHTGRMYGRDSKKMTKYVKQKGIEVERVPNQRVELENATERGGILTMPGVLAMNRGPILRGTWVLERILGEHLPDPPANVGQVEPNRRGENLTFRQRFEQHRSDATCASCHDKIDPLGFAFQAFDSSGKYIRGASYKPDKKQKKAAELGDPSQIDTSGELPSGERFENVSDLKHILQTSQREAVVRNIVRRTLSYALGRKLRIFDRPTVEAIVTDMIESGGTWRDLFVSIVGSVPFREMILAE